MPQVELHPFVGEASPGDSEYPGVAVGKPPRKGKATLFPSLGEWRRTKGSLCSAGKGRVAYAISLSCWESAAENFMLF